MMTTLTTRFYSIFVIHFLCGERRPDVRPPSGLCLSFLLIPDGISR